MTTSIPTQITTDLFLCNFKKFDFPAHEVTEFMWDWLRKIRIEQDMTRGNMQRILYRTGDDSDHNRVIGWTLKLPYPIEKREFMTRNVWQQVSHNNFVIAWTSIDGSERTKIKLDQKNNNGGGVDEESFNVAKNNQGSYNSYMWVRGDDAGTGCRVGFRTVLNMNFRGPLLSSKMIKKMFSFYAESSLAQNDLENVYR